MKLRIHSCRFLVTLLFWSLLFLVVGIVKAQVEEAKVADQPEATTTTTDDNDNDAATIQVEDYLESLTNEELENICHERGFAINASATTGTISRDDYLDAARQCLSLEDDINHILAQNPELAAELEVEIERMRHEKERLEQERQEMLRELQVLQQQLKQAGMDVQDYAAAAAQQQQQQQSLDNDLEYAPYSKNPANMTFVEVFRESLVLLAKRVHQDIQFVKSIIGPVLRPVGGALRLVWKYVKPIMLGAVHWIQEKIRKALQGTRDEESASELAAAASAVAVDEWELFSSELL